MNCKPCRLQSKTCSRCRVGAQLSDKQESNMKPPILSHAWTWHWLRMPFLANMHIGILESKANKKTSRCVLHAVQPPDISDKFGTATASSADANYTCMMQACSGIMFTFCSTKAAKLWISDRIPSLLETRENARVQERKLSGDI